MNTLEDCQCELPFPCLNPAPVEGTQCDNCGAWLTKERADRAAESAWNVALDKVEQSKEKKS